ncbi:MAG: hypothetical protein IJL87_06350 [Clostridia bacterium]|nr:hypothetical protein [Clostridia bacterium]
MRLLKNAFKIICAGLTAVAVLSVLLCAYSITPVHIDNPKGNTDYVWPSGAVWVRMTEGTSWGRFDQNGFNNMKVINNPDILILGSSHMEATYIRQSETVASRLNSMFDGKHQAYNLGVSNHNFYKACQYVPDNLEMYHPKYIVIESSTTYLDPNRVYEAVNHSIYKTQSHSTGIIGTLQKIPFVRLVYQQSETGLIGLFVPGYSSEQIEEPANEPYDQISDAPYDMLFGFLSAQEQKYNAKIIIFYHPPETLHEDGTISFYEADYLRKFTEKAQQYNIAFIDMTKPFEDMYYNEHHLPHGFITGEIGEGHLNRYGHKAIADEVYRVICALGEEQKDAND